MSDEQGLLQEWPARGPPLAWKIEGLGGGDSAPSIADGRMFGMSNRGDKEVVWALSEADAASAEAAAPFDQLWQGLARYWRKRSGT